MARGLEKILEKISENPRQTLVGRYLALIADIHDEDERASYALSLAERLVGTKTNDALRIAYMVYESGRHVVRALRIVIACFEDKGRAGKVAVLKLELAKLEKDLRDESPEESRRRQKPLPDLSGINEASRGQFALDASSVAPPPFRDPQPPREDTRMAELDLGELSQHDSAAEDAVDLLFPDRKEESFMQAEESRALPELDLAEGFFANFAGRPGDTVLPGLPHRFAEDPDDGARDDGSGTIVSRVIPKDQVKEKINARPPAQTVKLDDIPRITLDGPSRVSGFVPPAEPRQARGAAPSEIFDRFLTAGKFAEAEVVLESSRADSHFEWWRIRRMQLDAARQENAAAPQVPAPLPPTLPVAAFSGPGPVTSTVPNIALTPQPAEVTRPSREPAERPFSGDIRKGVSTEILRLADLMARSGLHVPPDQAGLFQIHETSGPMPVKLIQALQRLPLTSDAEKQLCFDLLQGLTGGSGSEECLQLMEQRGLSRHAPAWFGFYLDSLVFCGFARKALAEAVLVSERQQSLAWIRVIWQRLPAVWAQLGAAGFSWREEDGTKEFAAQIKKRPKPLLSHYLGI